MLAACSVIIAINIYHKDINYNENNDFFINCYIKNGLIELNLEFWNNYYIHKLTGYSIEDIK